MPVQRSADEQPEKPRLDMQQPRGTLQDARFTAPELAHHAEEFGVQQWDILGCMATANVGAMTKDELRSALAEYMRRSV
jgi:hypothetical protein